MKFTALANAFANAVALAALAADDKRVKTIAALEAARLAADGDTVKITSNILDHALALSVPAVVEEKGELAMPVVRLAALAAGFPPKTEITVQSDGPVTLVACGRSRFRLPTIPIDDLPAVPTIIEMTSGITLAREEALALFSRPFFAASNEQTQFYLCGILLHDIDDDLVAVATDGHRLARVTLAGATGLSSDRTLIIPNSAIKVLLRLLADKNNECITLERSRMLLAVEACSFRFVSKLIDSTYPSYERLIPRPSGNAVTIDRVELAQALDRIAAVIDPAVKAMRLVGLQWALGEPALRLCIPGHDLADDILDAEVAGTGKVALQILHLAEIAAEIEGKCIHIDTNGNVGPVVITDPDDPDVLILQMPCAWPFENATAA
jgi:DNA polymerase-3 subunit beta